MTDYIIRILKVLFAVIIYYGAYMESHDKIQSIILTMLVIIYFEVKK